MIGCFDLLAEAKFGSLRNTFATFTRLSELYLYTQDLFCSYKWKKRYQTILTATKVAGNHEDEYLGLMR